jgi:hypothetical protein
VLAVAAIHATISAGGAIPESARAAAAESASGRRTAVGTSTVAAECASGRRSAVRVATISGHGRLSRIWLLEEIQDWMILHGFRHHHEPEKKFLMYLLSRSQLHQQFLKRCFVKYLFTIKFPIAIEAILIAN